MRKLGPYDACGQSMPQVGLATMLERKSVMEGYGALGSGTGLRRDRGTEGGSTGVDMASGGGGGVGTPYCRGDGPPYRHRKDTL